jgi:hypothetical protein
MNISPKTAGATGGSVTGGAVSLILLWVFGLIRPDIVVPNEVAVAFSVVISGILAFAGGWLPRSTYSTPPSP